MTIRSVLILALLLAVQISADSVLRRKSYVPVTAPPERGSRWDPEIFSILSFGQLPAAIDSIWIDVLLDDRIAKVPRWMHASIFYDLDLVTRLDPAFYQAYHAGANLLAVVRDDIAGAKELIERGDAYRKEQLPHQSPEFQADYWPYPWAIPLLGGYIGLFEENDIPSAARYFKEAAEVPGAPGYLHNLEMRLSRPGGEYDVGLRLLNHMIASAPNTTAKQELISRRNSLMVGQYLFDMNHAFKGFLSANRNYRSQASVSSAQMEKYWHEFMKSGRYAALDPWGGRLWIDQSGRVNTTTAHEKVFGLDGAD
ncbi:MAG: hypothetical protein P4M08_11695 [Oligoflexia bacterium]|nr:hypothetical protein [Oligoflexia bacterium]